MSLNTTFLLLAQYNGKAIIPLEEILREPLNRKVGMIKDALEEARSMEPA